VEVKTTDSIKDQADLRTCGGNRSWNGQPKFLASQHCDLVFLLNLKTGAEREYPIEALEGRSTISMRASESSCFGVGGSIPSRRTYLPS